MTPNASDRMIDAAAEYLRDGEVVLVGVGAPSVAAWRAKVTHAPNIHLVYESGAIGSEPDVPPLSIGDPGLFADALGAMSVAEIFDFVIGGGRIDTAFVGAAQIDRYGNLNSTVIGNYGKPRVRLPGSGGACEILLSARRVLVMSPLENRRFPERVDFVTSRCPLSSEMIIVTDRAILAKPREEREVRLVEIMEGESEEEVRSEIGWPIKSGAGYESVASSPGSLDEVSSKSRSEGGTK